MDDESETGRRSNWGGKLLTALFFVVVVWITAGTEWSLMLEKEGFLTGVEVSDEAAEGDTCEATLDLSGLPAQPTTVAVRRPSGDEALTLESGRGSLSYPREGSSVELRLSFVGVLRKPTHANITLTQSRCRLQPTGLETMPLLPF